MNWYDFDERKVRKRLPVGARVRMSPEGYRQFPRYKDARGLVVGYKGALPTVKWDHRKTTGSYAPWFLHRVRGGASHE